MYPLLLAVTHFGLFSSCSLTVHWGHTAPGEHASPLKHSRQLMKAAWFPKPISEIYIPVQVTENNKLLHTVTDPTSQTTEFTSRLSDTAAFQIPL